MSDAQSPTTTSIFISYRRSASKYLARLLYERLRQGGVSDVFLDVESINAGHFDEALREQIITRTNFLLILAPGSLDRCNEPDDWFRHEIETAISTQRNIVPLLVDGFTFESHRALLQGRLAELPRYNGINLYYDYFDEAVEKLQRRFLQGGLVNGRSTTPPPLEPPTPAEIQAEQTALRAYLYQQAGELDEATRHYTQALHLNPDHDMAYHNRGLARYAQGDTLGAIADYSAALHINPTDDAAYLNRGVAYAARRQWNKAHTDYNRALELNPTYAVAYYSRGNMRYELGDLQGALADYTQALHHNPHLGAAYLNRGVVYHDLGHHQAAISDYSQLLALDPNHADAYNNRGNVYYTIGDVEAALADYDAATALQHPHAYHNRARLRMQAADMAGALADFDAAAALLPESAMVLFNRGDLRLALGDTLGAIADFSAVQAINPAEVGAWVRRGLAYEQHGDLKAALADYEHALALGAVRLFGAEFNAHVLELRRRVS